MDLVAGQFGVFAREQALAHGISDGVIRWQLRAETWIAPHRGVYVVGGSPRSWEQSLMVAYISAGPRAHVSHRSAGRLWGLLESSLVEVSTPRRMESDRLASFHRIGELPPGDVVELRPFRVSSPTRTLIDLAAVLPLERLEVVVDDALRRRLTSLARLRWRLDRVGAKGVHGARLLRRVVTDRDPAEAPESVLERTFLRLLRAHGLPRPRTQFVVRDGDGFVARLDFAYPEQRVAVEVDGYSHHSGRIAWERDRTRRNRLESLGWQVLNATARQMRERPGDVLVPLARLLGTAI